MGDNDDGVAALQVLDQLLDPRGGDRVERGARLVHQDDFGADGDGAGDAQALLLDEPASALDPIATAAIEDLIHDLKKDFTVVIVTHNLQQAQRVADRTAFFNLEATGKPGHLVEYDSTDKIFSAPSQQATEDYISGRFG